VVLSSSASGSLTRLLMPDDAGAIILQNIRNCMLYGTMLCPRGLEIQQHDCENATSGIF